MINPSSEPSTLPSLTISCPGVDPRDFVITVDKVTVGRLADVNDIVLAPDPEQYVSGRSHCEVVYEAKPVRNWYVVDDNSRNGTFLSHKGERYEVQGKEILSHGDVICILAKLGQGEPPTYWELAFSNPLATNDYNADARLEYDWVAGRLYRIASTRRREITPSRPLVHRLVRYMLQRNRKAGGKAVLCLHDELMAEVWGEKQEQHCPHTHQELNALIAELRRCIELDPREPRFVQTVRGLGFRLEPRPPKS
jgi:hypothetical protein